MRALTTRSTLTGVGSYNYPRCSTNAYSSTPASDDHIFYNSGATTGACGYFGKKCACQCPPSPPAPPLPPPYAPFAWTTFSSGADCEANGCITPSSQAECEDAMRALTTKSKLTGTNSYTSLPRCFTQADSSTPGSTDASTPIYYNSNATTGACGNFWHCACQCYHPSPSAPPPPAPPPAPPPPPDMCECTGDGNKISCSGTGVRSCGGGEECFAQPGTSYPFGQWSDLCAEMCACTGVGNQMRCSVAGVRYCGGGEECFAPPETSHPFGRWSDLCRQSGRRLQQSSA